jgi:hypothetical protein
MSTMNMLGFTAEDSIYPEGRYHHYVAESGALSQSYRNVFPASFDQCVKCVQLAPILCGDDLRCILSLCRGPCRPVLKDEP